MRYWQVVYLPKLAHSRIKWCPASCHTKAPPVVAACLLGENYEGQLLPHIKYRTANHSNLAIRIFSNIELYIKTLFTYLHNSIFTVCTDNSWNYHLTVHLHVCYCTRLMLLKINPHLKIVTVFLRRASHFRIVICFWWRKPSLEYQSKLNIYIKCWNHYYE